MLPGILDSKNLEPGRSIFGIKLATLIFSTYRNSHNVQKLCLEPILVNSKALDGTNMIHPSLGNVNVYGIPRTLWKEPSNSLKLTKKQDPMKTVSEFEVIGECVVTNRKGF